MKPETLTFKTIDPFCSLSPVPALFSHSEIIPPFVLKLIMRMTNIEREHADMRPLIQPQATIPVMTHIQSTISLFYLGSTIKGTVN